MDCDFRVTGTSNLPRPSTKHPRYIRQVISNVHLLKNKTSHKETTNQAINAPVNKILNLNLYFYRHDLVKVRVSHTKRKQEESRCGRSKNRSRGKYEGRKVIRVKGQEQKKNKGMRKRINSSWWRKIEDDE